MKTMNLAVVCVILSLLSPSTSLASDGATPIWEPTTITEPGKYVLTRSIHGKIYVNADDVEIDLNGFTLGDWTALSAVNVSGLAVRNGTITGIGDDELLYLSEVKRFSIRRLKIKGVGEAGIRIGGGSSGVIEDVEFDGDSPWLGIAVHIYSGSSGIEVRGVRVSGAVNQGLLVDCTGCKIVGNTITNSGNGITVSGQGNIVMENVVSSCQGNGIGVGYSEHGNLRAATLNELSENSFVGNAGFGVRMSSASSGSLLRGNTVRGNGGTSCAGTSSGSDFCDEGTNNTSHGDNYMPDQM